MINSQNGGKKLHVHRIIGFWKKSNNWPERAHIILAIRIRTTYVINPQYPQYLTSFWRISKFRYLITCFHHVELRGYSKPDHPHVSLIVLIEEDKRDQSPDYYQNKPGFMNVNIIDSTWLFLVCRVRASYRFICSKSQSTLLYTYYSIRLKLQFHEPRLIIN